MNQRRVPLPPPWCLVLLGTVFMYWAYEHYLQMIEFEDGQIDQISMYWFMILLYKTTGFWPTVILPFAAAGAITLGGVSLQVRDLRRRIRGEADDVSYEPVRWKGLLIALIVVVGVITAFIGVGFLLKS